MNLDLESVFHYGLERAVDLLNRGFADYVVPIELDAVELHHMVVQDGIDVSSSCVVHRNGQPVGIALIARRGWTSRLAATALVPEARGAGIGGWLMNRLIGEAQARGERAMVLEVIEQNTPALRLYRKSCPRSAPRRPAGPLSERALSVAR